MWTQGRDECTLKSGILLSENYGAIENKLPQKQLYDNILIYKFIALIMGLFISKKCFVQSFL